MKHKDEAVKMFKEFKYLIENQTWKKIKISRSENGGEYTSNEFIGFCKKEGIKKETTMPYTLKQNGVVERKKKYIVEATRAMLHDQKVSKFLQGEETNVVVYAQNRLPHQELETRPLKKCS